MGLFDIFGDILGLSTDPQTQQLSTMTPEQQQYYSQMLSGLGGYNPQFIQQSQYTPSAFQGGYTPTGYTGAQYTPSAFQGGYTPMAFQGGYTPTQYGGSQYQQQMGSALAGALSGRPAYQITPEATEQYYREAIRDPAMAEYENVTRPAWMQKISNIHGSARDIQEQRGYEELGRNLGIQRQQLMREDVLSGRQAAESAAQRQLAGIGAGTGMSQQELAAWQSGQQLGLGASEQQRAAWQASQQFGFGANEQQLAQWQAANQMQQQAQQLGMSQWGMGNQMQQAANQQALQQWQLANQFGLSADQNRLAYQQAMLQQSYLPYQLMMQGLGMSQFENLVTPSTMEQFAGLLGGAGSLLSGAGLAGIGLR